jgi:hypothetical protein
MSSLLLVESFDLRPSNQYILVRVIPSCFHFAKLCLCQVSLLPMCIPRYLTSPNYGLEYFKTLILQLGQKFCLTLLSETYSKRNGGRNVYLKRKDSHDVGVVSVSGDFFK